MKRRELLKTAYGASLASALADFVGASGPAALDVGSLFEANSPEVLALAERVMQRCVLDKIMSPTPPLKQNWIAPGGPYYKGQWIWDTMFVVDLLSILPGKKKQIRNIFRDYWDFQDRWNEDAPEYARDMVTVAIKTEPEEVRQFSQIPILAWGVERVYQRNGDQELLRQCLGRLERFHDWYWRERDLHDNGLITLGAYTGKLQHAKWETFDYECDMDDMRMADVLASPAWLTPLPVPTVDRTDKRWKSDAFWRGDVWPPTNYQIASGLAAYGHRDLAANIADKTVANAIKNGISEHYDSISGRPLGIRDYCMGSTLVTMMLDGLTHKYRLRLLHEGNLDT